VLSYRPNEIWSEQYAEWIEKADTKHDVPGADVYRHYLDVLQIAPEHVVLDLGVGTGRLLLDLTARARFVCGMDISKAMITRAKRWLGAGVGLVLGDAQRLPFAAESFDHIVAWAVWENIPDQRLALYEAARVLRPGGRLLLSSKNLTNARCLRLAWWRVKGNLVRMFWRWARERPSVVRMFPNRLRAKFEQAVRRVDIPQYPTLWPAFVLRACNLGMRLKLLHKFTGAGLDDDCRAPDRAWTHQQLIAVFEKARA